MGKYTDISTLVFNDLSASAPLAALLSNGVESIYPLIADAEEGDVFITYATQYDSKPSKDAAFEFTVIIRSWAVNYNDTLAVADQVTTALVNNGVSKYRELSGKPVFNEQNEFYIEQIFNIKK